MAYPEAGYWTLHEPDAYSESWTHLYVGTTAWESGALDELLRLVANDGNGGVIIAPADLGWFYLPYDGGADVIAESPLERDHLRDRHRSWLSVHPSGL